MLADLVGRGNLESEGSLKNQLIAVIGFAALRCSCFAADSVGPGEGVYPPGG